MNSTTTFLSLFVPQTSRFRLEGLVFILAITMVVGVGFVFSSTLYSFDSLKDMKIPKILGGSLENLQKFEAPSFDLFGEILQPIGDRKLYKSGHAVDGIDLIVWWMTDESSLIGQLLINDIIGLEMVGIPFSAFIRHNFPEVFGYAGRLPYQKIKPATAGDTMVFDVASGKMKIPQGKSGNAGLRKGAGIFANIREYAGITFIRTMPMMPYSRKSSEFRIKNGVMRSVMETSIDTLPFALRYWLREISIGNAKAVFIQKPTQNDEGAYYTALVQEVLDRLHINVKKPFKVDYRQQERNTDKVDENGKMITTKLGADVNEQLAALGDEFWSGINVPQSVGIEFYLNDYGFEQLLNWVIEQQKTIILTCDDVGDYGTDQLLGTLSSLERFLSRAASTDVLPCNPRQVMIDMGYDVGGSAVSTLSELMCMDGKKAVETILGTAPELFSQLLKGQDPAYDLRGNWGMLQTAALWTAPYHQDFVQYIADCDAAIQQTYRENPSVGMIGMYWLLKERIQHFAA